MKGSKIEWTDHTFNGWQGCTKRSPGCAHCYAEARDQRFYKGTHWGKGAPRLLASEASWMQPLKWNERAICNYCGYSEVLGSDDCRKCGHEFNNRRRARVFCNSLADWLDGEVPIEWLARLLELIHDTPNLDWLLLSKTPENFFARLDAVCESGSEVEDWIGDWFEGKGRGPANVWIGASVEDQQRANERIPELLKIPARIRFLSVEPMLGPINLRGIQSEDGIAFSALETGVLVREKVDWVIFGGESGPGARPCNLEWIRDGISQCRETDVAAFVKQLGARPCFWNKPDPDARATLEPIKLNDKKGGDMSEWPEDLRVREFPAPEEIAREAA